MATTTDRPEAKTMPEAQASPEHGSRPPASRPNDKVDKYAEARKAKKKAKRMRHRAKLKRSHTKG